MSINGYTRVSQIIGQFKDFSGIDPEVLQRKADLGTEVHEGIETFLSHDIPILSDKASPYFDSFHEFFTKHPFEVIQKEKRFYCDMLNITGKVDLIAKTGGEIQLIDFKCTAQIDFVFWPLQACFYHYLVSPDYPSLSTKVLFLQLRKKASPKKFVVEITDDLWNTCLSAYNLYLYIQQKKC